ncbi:RsmB/NOP family class I SAM-dependent RNA methyltransferase [Altererythrobacter lutimaris]|uniref:RsmB/NOP family class I SAM-dependent RNA methyltransferase n=1 Tax=Altererythrobacter lutimaris TaxID=2743979 RepID=A0A850HDA4_9SPHN|nr:RsmB/NOP family class I SAM-dependent RNA methyltransferase [Altererythrobacter lutimaris]NVE95580.1 RsmB/NOP family class I SAM-dependent RNA methyltransferase [Altererythrobacter lutimaris]
MAQPPGIHARRGALKLLDAVLRRGETIEQAQGAALKDIRKPADKALALALANEALRWMVDLDTLIDSATKKPLPDDAKPRMVLRLMLAGWLRLETPPHAVIATGLPLLSGGPRRLAHGVFSTLSRREVALPEVPTLPAEVAARWDENAALIAQGLALPPEVDLAVKDIAATEQWQARLGGVSLMPGHVRIPRGTAIDKLEGYAEGAWWVQDLAAQLPAHLLGSGEGKHALDLCAAPGGKTLALARNGWKVTALDISKRRLGLLKENLKRTGLKASTVRADALNWEPKHQFDAILLDAPCTATGTCRRHPDVLHRIGSRQIEEMAELQAGLIERASGWLKPGATLVYAVCSLEREEGEEQAAQIDLDPSPITDSDLPDGLAPTPEGWLRTHPGMIFEEGGLDGFFVARFTR